MRPSSVRLLPVMLAALIVRVICRSHFVKNDSIIYRPIGRRDFNTIFLASSANSDGSDDGSVEYQNTADQANYFYRLILYTCSQLLDVAMTASLGQDYGNLEYIFGDEEDSTRETVYLRLQDLQAICEGYGPYIYVYRSENDLPAEYPQAVATITTTLTSSGPATTVTTTLPFTSQCIETPLPGQTPIPGYIVQNTQSVVLCDAFWNLYLAAEDSCWDSSQLMSFLTFVAGIDVVMNLGIVDGLQPYALGSNIPALPAGLKLRNQASYAAFAQQIGHGCSNGVQDRPPMPANVN